ncbi:GntR family transcriptional regulator [Paracoccus sp. S-4012]|uniref:GntR family transcriptional regulator n=1 Tax=Paracoccus sp. S-4012 TaxID=2665648 RepID=UPI0012AFAAD5|nr:GntR family transcriptional regulator [Paracoccus sp. S-4012]MRX52041.1 GntR family transcriptional regulator [Paracoccus sp. S-4012]
MTDQPLPAAASGPDEPPLYAQLADKLRQQIQTGASLPGERLPTEAKLSESSGLSRITVRHALRILSDEGLIERFPGRGTFVTDRLGSGGWALRSINDLVQIGKDVKTEVLSWRKVPPPPAMQALFGSSGPLWRLRAVRTQGALPLYFVENYQRGDVGDRVEVSDLEKHTMVEVICHKLRIPVSHAVEDIRVGHTSALMARHLWVPTGQPVVVQQIDIYEADGRLIQSGSGWWHSNRLRRRFQLSLA